MNVLEQGLRRIIEAAGITQQEAAERFGVTQPRVSDLVRGKIELFSIDALINMLAAASHHVEISVTDGSDGAAQLHLGISAPHPAFPHAAYRASRNPRPFVRAALTAPASSQSAACSSAGRS